MNDILRLDGRFEQKKSGGKPGPANIPIGQNVNIGKIIKLRNELNRIQDFWEEQQLSINPLVSVYYTDVVAKGNRIKGLLESNAKKNNETIVGAKFTKGEQKKHIITHCISKEVLVDAINNLDKVILVFEDNFENSISHDVIEDINHNKYENIFNKRNKKTKYDITRSRFVNAIVDAYYVEKLGIEQDTEDFQEQAIVTIYDTGIKSRDIMNQIGIDLMDNRKINETTFLLTPDEYNLLKLKAPYLISMAVTDITKFDEVNSNFEGFSTFTIPDPTNEPTIGVIDTMFDENVYFSKWVEFKNMLNKDIPIDSEDMRHGTMVDSIIVDGAKINPELDDGCGRFKVRHFGVAKQGKFSSFTVLKLINEIVQLNRDIKVWNLSLGSVMEINPNFISPEAAILDEIQYENDVLFVIAGTNKPQGSTVKKIGAPADSINSLVVNSVDFDDEPATYSREGLVLSFFNKPDISYYGGDKNRGIKVCAPLGQDEVKGTSFAAPWIARKVAYLIEVLGLTRELAKALIIDSATGWTKQTNNPRLIGYGVVPIRIEDIIQSKDDEIKFMIDCTSENYETYNYNIPIPEDKGKIPFISKATLCYFPRCTRNQGVDYTNTELDIHFGKLSKKHNGNIVINSINDNKQADEANILMYEGTARKIYRKWDNVKHIQENIMTSNGGAKRPKSKGENGMWGISIRRKERLNSSDGEHLKFGAVVTLKEINGVNRIQEFIQQCQFRGWLVNRLDIENQIDIYNISEEEIEFE